MKCDEIKTLLNSYVDNEVSRADAERVRKHLGECPACAKEAADLNKVKEMLRKLPALSAPTGLLEGVRCNLARPNPELLQRSNAFLRYRWLTLSLASAAAVILVVFTVMIQSRKNDIQIPALSNEKAKSNLNTSVMAKTNAPDAIQAQPMLFTQQINISTGNVDNAVAQVYAAASTQTPDLRLRAEYQKMQAAQEELMTKAPAEPPIQDEAPTATNSVVSMRKGKSQQQRQLGQVVKISIPLSQKEAFIKQLQGNIRDKIVLSEMQATSPVGQQEALKEGYLADGGKAMTESEERQTPDNKNEYDKMARGGGRKSDSKQAEADKIGDGKSGAVASEESNDAGLETTGSAKGDKESPKDKPVEQPKPSPKATAGAPPPPPATPAPSAPVRGKGAAAPPSAPPAKGFGQARTEGKEDIRQDKDMKKQNVVDGIINGVSQSVQVQPEPMIEFIIFIEPDEK